MSDLNTLLNEFTKTYLLNPYDYENMTKKLNEIFSQNNDKVSKNNFFTNEAKQANLTKILNCLINELPKLKLINEYAGLSYNLITRSIKPQDRKDDNIEMDERMISVLIFWNFYAVMKDWNLDVLKMKEIANKKKYLKDYIEKQFKNNEGNFLFDCTKENRKKENKKELLKYEKNKLIFCKKFHYDENKENHLDVIVDHYLPLITQMYGGVMRIKINYKLN